MPRTISPNAAGSQPPPQAQHAVSAGSRGRGQAARGLSCSTGKQHVQQHLRDEVDGKERVEKEVRGSVRRGLMWVVGRDHRGRSAAAGTYEAAVSVQRDETLPFFLVTNAIVHLYLQKKMQPCTLPNCAYFCKAKSLVICAKKKLCWSLQGTCRTWIVQI